MMEGYPSSAYYVLKPELDYKKIVYVPDFLLITLKVLVFPPDME